MSNCPHAWHAAADIRLHGIDCARRHDLPGLAMAMFAFAVITAALGSRREAEEAMSLSMEWAFDDSLSERR